MLFGYNIKMQLLLERHDKMLDSVSSHLKCDNALFWAASQAIFDNRLLNVYYLVLNSLNYSVSRIQTRECLSQNW